MAGRPQPAAQGLMINMFYNSTFLALSTSPAAGYDTYREYYVLVLRIART
jgi:hypothetical protein